MTIVVRRVLSAPSSGERDAASYLVGIMTGPQLRLGELFIRRVSHDCATGAAAVTGAHQSFGRRGAQGSGALAGSASRFRRPILSSGGWPPYSVYCSA